MASLAEFRAALVSLPAGCSVTVSAADLAAWLAELTTQAPEPPVDAPELTITEAATRLRRSASAVRGWCASGALQGAYLLRGKSWRIPRAALEAFIAGEPRAAIAPPPAGTAAADLRAWRTVRRQRPA